MCVVIKSQNFPICSFPICCNVIGEIHLQLADKSVDDARESSLSSLKEKKPCSSSLKYDIKQWSLECINNNKKIQSRS